MKAFKLLPLIIRKKTSGQAMVQSIGVLFATLMTGAFAIDTGFYFSVHSGMQNAADAAAHAAALELFKYVPAANGSPQSTNGLRLAAAKTKAKTISVENMGNQLNDADIEFGYVNPITGIYNPNTFTTPTNDPAFSLTSGYNAVRVTVKAGDAEANGSVPSIFAKIFGVNNIASSAQAVAIYGGGINSASGLRPLYLCETAYNKAIELYGDPSKPEITFYGSTLKVGNTTINQASSCGNLGPGNWGMADFDGGGGGNSQFADTLLHGYPGVVSVGQSYGPKPGNSLNSSGATNALETLKTNGTVFSIPLYSQTTGNGKNAQFKISAIAGFVITDYQTSGNNSYIKGYFRKSTCSTGCSIGNQTAGGSVTKIRLIH